VASVLWLGLKREFHKGDEHGGVVGIHHVTDNLVHIYIYPLTSSTLRIEPSVVSTPRPMPDKILVALHHFTNIGFLDCSFVWKNVKDFTNHGKSLLFLTTDHKKLQVLIDWFLREPSRLQHSTFFTIGELFEFGIGTPITTCPSGVTYPVNRKKYSFQKSCAVLMFEALKG
jgi:hypothetical protein